MLSSQGAGPSGSGVPYPPLNHGDRPPAGKAAPNEAASVLDRPALVEGFSAVPREPKFLGLAGKHRISYCLAELG